MGVLTSGVNQRMCDRRDISEAGSNGGANGHSERAGEVVSEGVARSNGQSDAPACAGCGWIMIRSGTCYRCENCGSTSGCS